MIAALADSIQILPTGACLDLQTRKGLVLADNPADFLHPMILNFKDNQIYDLSDPETSDQLQIVDIMKTMDNRIAIDSDTLKQFVADPYIKATADRFRAQKEKINQSSEFSDIRSFSSDRSEQITHNDKVAGSSPAGSTDIDVL